MVSDGPSMIIGQPSGGISLVVSQRWVEAANSARPHPDENQITTIMQAMGFTRLFSALFGWWHEENSLVILDAKPDNFILTPSGILPIDLLIAEAPPDA